MLKLEITTVASPAAATTTALWAKRPYHKEIITHDQKTPTNTSIYQHCGPKGLPIKR